MKKILLTILVVFISNLLLAQISSYSPEFPKESDSLFITYNPFEKGSRFSINDEVYAIIWESFQDGNTSTGYKKMMKNDSVFVVQLYVAKNISYYTIHFITLSTRSWGAKATLNILAYTDDGITLRNGLAGTMNSENRTEIMKKELELYPDNFAVYRNKWFYDKHDYPEDYKNIITKDKELLEQNNVLNIEKLYTLSYAHALLGNYEMSISLIEEMIRNYNSHSYVFGSIGSLIYELNTNNIQGDLLNKCKLISEELLKNSNSETAKEFFYSKAFIFPGNTVLELCNKWMSDDSDDPRPYFLLAYFGNENSVNLEESERLMKTYLEKLLSGKLRLYSDVSGKTTSMYLPYAYYTLADISYKLGNYSNALSAIKTSQSLNESNKKDEYKLEGDIWFQLRDYKRAEKAYLASWEEGRQDAKELLASCYGKTRNSNEGFEKYFINITGSEKETNQDNSNKKIKTKDQNKAPDFNVVSLKGDKYSLSELEGKIIVMNFWFMGCGPCRQEMPVLNELKSEYEGKNVVFLAFTLDDDIELLEKFLNKYEFRFEIIADSRDVANNYKISYYPSSLVIDNHGNIVTRFQGGGDKIKDNLKTVIERLL